MKIKRNGYTRTVYLLGPFAFKIPSLRYGTRAFVMGLYANIQERDIWRDSNHAPCFAPVWLHIPFGLLNIAKRFNDCEPPLPDDIIKRLPLIGKADLKSDNFGIDENGQLVLLDYGNMDLYLIVE